MADPNDIITALGELDHNDDAHWAKDGQPLMKVMQDLVSGVTREEITNAAPEFVRHNPVLPGEGDEAEAPVSDALDDDEDDDAGHAAELKRAASVVASARKDRDAAQRKLQEAERAYDEIVNRNPPADGHDHQKNQDDISAYLKRQKQQLERRGARRVQLAKAGIEASDLDPRSPLDRAMARKTGYGNDRPGGATG